MNQCIRLLYMFPMVGLHMFYSMLIILMPVNKKKSLGNHAYLSSWCLRYGLDDMIFTPFLFKCLGTLFENLKNPFASSSLICQSPTSAIWWYFLKTIYTYGACFCIELCQIIVTLERALFMLSLSFAWAIKKNIWTHEGPI